MRLWSIRRPEEMRRIHDGLPLRTDSSFVDRDDLRAYRWMAMRLRERVPTSEEIEFPLWAWYRCETPSGVPNITASGMGISGESYVLVECEIPAAAVLLSDYQKWHAVLNRHYLPLTWHESEAFETAVREAGITTPGRNVVYPDALERRMEASWLRIFDLESPSECWEPPDEREIQAVFWELRPDHVVSETPYIARSWGLEDDAP